MKVAGLHVLQVQLRVQDNNEMATLHDFLSFVFEQMNTCYPHLSLVIPFQDLDTLRSSKVYEWCGRALEENCITYRQGDDGSLTTHETSRTILD